MNAPKKERGSQPSSLPWKLMTQEEKSDCIVNAVLRLVAKYGVQGTTTARIAAAAGVSEPTLYRTFRNRRDMLLAAADKVWNQRQAELESFEPANAMDYLYKLSEHHTLGIQRTRVVRFLTELAVAPPGDGLGDYLHDKMLIEAEHLIEIVEEGKSQGCIRPDVDAKETGWRIMAVYWVEAMARLHGLEDVVLSGFSTRSFQSILRDVTAESPLTVSEDSLPEDRSRT